jgi:hypothetical protein
MSPLMITETPISQAPQAPTASGRSLTAGDARAAGATAERRRYVRRAAVVEAAWLAQLR